MKAMPKIKEVFKTGVKKDHIIFNQIDKFMIIPRDKKKDYRGYLGKGCFNTSTKNALIK
jgi:hypothetical protein